MLELIVAVDENNGIGKAGKIPWYCKEDLNLFKNKTIDSTIIVGRKTCENLPKLSRRKIICLTRGVPNTTTWNNNECLIINSVEDFFKIYDKDERYFVCGGSDIYNLFIPYCDTIHISNIKGVHDCDTFLNSSITNGFDKKSQDCYENFTHEVWKNNTNEEESNYLNIAKNIISENNVRIGRNGKTLSSFCNNMKFDLRTGFPLITTKKMHIRGIIEELLFFLKGETNSNILSEKGIKIWNGNTTDEFIKSRGLSYEKGDMGPMYGYQWRYFNKPYNTKQQSNIGIDQLQNVIKLITDDPGSRRILLTSYNPCQAEEGVLYPCHSIIIQFYVDGDFLDMFCYNRSQDFFLGTPYNIASSSLLLTIVSKVTQKIPRYLNITMGDTHIYDSHITQMKTQIERTPYRKPFIHIDRELSNLDDVEKLTYEDFNLLFYNNHKVIKGDMVI